MELLLLHGKPRHSHVTLYSQQMLTVLINSGTGSGRACLVDRNGNLIAEHAGKSSCHSYDVVSIQSFFFLYQNLLLPTVRPPTLVFLSNPQATSGSPSPFAQKRSSQNLASSPNKSKVSALTLLVRLRSSTNRASL